MRFSWKPHQCPAPPPSLDTPRNPLHGRGNSIAAAMATLSLRCSLPLHPPHEFPHSRLQLSCRPLGRLNGKRKQGMPRRHTLTVRAGLPHEAIVDAAASLASTSQPPHFPLFTLSAAEGSVGYSLASYYTSLGLFVISVPGLWSLIKRSVKSKIVKKTFELSGVVEKKAPKQVAGEILAFFTRNNFSVLDRGETITFEGMMLPSRGQAALLTFCTCISLASVGLVLSIAVPEGGNNWFWLTSLSPLAGVYYWTRASRKEEIKVKMILADDGSLSEIVVQGDDQQVEQMSKDLQLSEKGMVYVKGLFER